MEKNETGSKSINTLTEAFQQDIRRIWTAYQEENSSKETYALVMYGNEEAEPFLFPVMLSEEGLTQVGKKYVEKGYMDTLDEARRALRYSVDDAPDPYKNEKQMTALKNAMAEGDELKGISGLKILVESAILALSTLEKEGLFGKGKSRGSLLLLVIVIETDQDYMKDSVRRLNPARLSKEFLEFIKPKGPFRSCSGLILSPDGSTLYGATNVPQEKSGGPGSGQNQIVAYSLSGRTLTPRWDYRFPCWGDSVRGMAVSPKGDLWTLRMQYNGFGSSSKATSLIQQFSPFHGKPLQEKSIEEGPVALITDEKGRRVFLLTDEAVLEFTSSLRLKRRTELKERAYSILKMSKNTFLLASESGVCKMDKRGRVESTPIQGKTHSLSTDKAKRWLVVGEWFKGRPGETDTIEIPVTLYDAHTLKEERKFHLPGHQLVYPKLSPHGKWVICLANRIHGNRKSMVLFDTASGAVLGQGGKTDLCKDMIFLSDNRTLAYPFSGSMDSEPIRFLNLETMS
jgi:hypothetical protein